MTQEDLAGWGTWRGGGCLQGAPGTGPLSRGLQVAASLRTFFGQVMMSRAVLVAQGVCPGGTVSSQKLPDIAPRLRTDPPGLGKD